MSRQLLTVVHYRHDLHVLIAFAKNDSIRSGQQLAQTCVWILRYFATASCGNLELIHSID